MLNMMQYTLDSQLIVWIVSQLKARLNTVSMRQEEANIGFFKTKGIVEKYGSSEFPDHA